MAKGGTLIRIQSVMRQLAMSHPTDGMNEVASVKILEPILIRIVGVGATIEFMSRGVLNSILVTSILVDS